uniref:Uncharacterized protein n=1 Tax=Panagrolaimus superbus TaxID=310955 RepID=A0A914Y5U2_9BILA
MASSTATTSRPSAISSSTSYTTTNLRLPRRVRLDIVPETIYENDESDAEEESFSRDETNSSEIEYHPSHNKVGNPPHFSRINEFPHFLLLYFKRQLFSEAAVFSSSTNNSNEEVATASRPRRPPLAAAQSVPLINPQNSAAIRQALWVSRRLSTINSSDSPTDSSDYYSHLRKERSSFIGGGEEQQQRHAHPTVSRRASMFVRRMSMAIPTLSADPVPQSHA